MSRQGSCRRRGEINIVMSNSHRQARPEKLARLCRDCVGAVNGTLYSRRLKTVADGKSEV